MASKTQNKPLPALFPGSKFRAAAQASVDAILAPQGIRRPVISMGNEFKNADSWTGIQFVQNFIDWCQNNPGCVPVRRQVEQMVQSANQYRNDNPKILLARTPDKLNRRTQLALVGGGYHEAWHTQYSKRDAIRVEDVWSLTQRVGEITNNGGKFDKKLAGLLKTFNAVIEDIRIERLGCKEYPGVKVPMHDLQDFILDLEKKSRLKAIEMLGTEDVTNARGVLLCVFRDLGLGYNTNSAREAIDFYKKTAPDAVAMCVAGGLLHPHIQASKALGPDDKMGYVRVAMECVIALWKAGQADGDPEEQPDLCCPNCGATASNLVIRPSKKFGKAEIECKVCGFKTEAPLPDRSLDLNQQKSDQDEKEQPEYEGFPPEENDGGGEGDDEQDSDDKKSKDKSKSKPEKGDKSDSDSEDGDEDEGSEDGDEGSEDGDEQDGEDGDEDGDGEGSEGEGEDGDEDGDEDGEGNSKGEGEGEDGEDGDEDGDGDGEGDSDGDDSDGDGDQNEDGPGSDGKPQEQGGSGGAGGHSYLGQDAESTSAAAQEVLGSDEGNDPLDSSGALTLAFAAEHDKENSDLSNGERPWNPYNPSADEARIVRSNNVEGDRAKANKMLKEVKTEIAALRGRLRSIVRAQEMTDTEHGLRRGRRISERMLVDSKLCLMDFKRPTRAYQDKEDTLDTSLSMAICLDQSGSMCGMLREVAKAMMVLTEPVEAIGGKVMAFGFRDGKYTPEGYYSMYGQNTEHHRLQGVHYDVFKTWEERFTNVKWRFAHTQATGGTPMADGVQFGLTALNGRPEAHRILAVITDGYPNSPHSEVIRGQIRRAQAKGIHVLGIGIGRDAEYVKNLFPDYVYSQSVSDLPKGLIVKLNEICDFGGRGRGKRMKLDNRMTKRVS